MKSKMMKLPVGYDGAGVVAFDFGDVDVDAAENVTAAVIDDVTMDEEW